MPSNLDLTTINALQGAIVTAIRNQRTQWEQDSSDLASDGRLSSALMLEHWAFATGLLETMVSNECSVLFGKALDAHLSSSNRSAKDQTLDALAIELASAQDEPELIAA